MDVVHFDMGQWLVRNLRGQHKANIPLLFLDSSEAQRPPSPKAMSLSAQMPALQKQRQMQ